MGDSGLKPSRVLVVLAVLYSLHFDFWFWQRSDLVLGIPVGLLYHLGYCLVLSLALGLLIRARPKPLP